MFLSSQQSRSVAGLRDKGEAMFSGIGMMDARNVACLTAVRLVFQVMEEGDLVRLHNSGKARLGFRQGDCQAAKKGAKQRAKLLVAASKSG